MHLVETLLSGPWAMDPSIFNAIMGAAHRLDAAPAGALGALRPVPMAPTRRLTARAPGGARNAAPTIAVVPVHGVLAHRAAYTAVRYGLATSTEAISAACIRAAADPAVKTIVLDVDCPGGSVFGVQELADTLAKIRDRVRLVAVANGTAASGGYWIASQAHELVVTPSGMVGSIGVLMAHQDLTRLRERLGVRTEYISAGRHKAEGFNDGPLGKDQRAHLQQQVDTYFAAFTKAVARGRGATLQAVQGPAFGEGRMVLARDAVTRGMADQVATLEQVLRRLGVSAADQQGRAGLPMRAADADIALASLH